MITRSLFSFDRIEFEQSKLSQLFAKFFLSAKKKIIAQCKHNTAKTKFSSRGSSLLRYIRMKKNW